jgi:CheY-like chemotaxis protein
MSSDTAFAAQFWLWPDPAMKRDAHGRIIFINAAFLQLYGGTVEAWTGNVLQGWPAPQPLNADGTAPAPYRFETRIPAQDPAMGEQIYDWIEQTDQSGCAFALARNVTTYTQASMPTPPGQPMTPPVEAERAAAPEAEPVQDTLEQMTPSYDQAPLQVPEKEPEPVMEAAAAMPAPEAIETVQEVLPTYESEPAAAPSIDDSSLIIEPATEAMPAPAQEQVQPEQEERDFERRALPIESNSAVLGNNWRDAVIAKAVGVESATAEEPAPVQTTPAPEASEGSDGPKRILLAEDNAINALLTRTLLEAEGHIVETVEDGVLAVEAMKTQSFDLIFMDMRMPNMDGLESTRKIRQLPNVPKNLPIVALTANAFDDDRNACFDSGMNDFMTKPVSAEELSAMVKNWTGKKELEMTG